MVHAKLNFAVHLASASQEAEQREPERAEAASSSSLRLSS